MKVVEEESSIASWVTIICLLGLVAVGAIAYKNRDRLFPSDAATPVAVRAKLSEEVETKFFEARDAIVSGKYDEAAAILTALDTDKVPQPTRNWMTMQNGLARLLAGKLPEAKAEFAKVETRGLYTKDPREEKLAKFFVEAAHRAASDEPQTADAAKSFDPETTEAFALLILGLKDWSLGQFDDASYLFRQFKTSTPPESEVWLRRYKPIGDAYVESYSAFQIASDAAKGASSRESKEHALEAIRDAKAKIKGQPALVAKLGALETDLKTQVDAAVAEMNKQSDAAEAADQQIINDVKTRVAAFNEKLQFGDALQIAFTATVDGDKAKAELDRILKRSQWLSKFKNTLVKDINASGYAKPLTKKDSSVLATGVKTADDLQLLTPTKVPVKWAELASDSVIAMVKDFAAKAPPAEANDRKWGLGNYLYQLGRKPEALALLREAAPGNAEYTAGLALFPENAAK
jgi:tetratricopeptide (TPR) repeat protein